MGDACEGSSPNSQTTSWTLGLKRNIACYLARGVAIAQFDDDDLYSPDYLNWVWPKLQHAAPCGNQTTSGSLGPVASKLSEWHLMDLSNLSFHYLDVVSNKKIPLAERRGALYGWGFSYVFTREAWELAPFPDVSFAEDVGFMEGLLARGITVSLLQLPPDRGMIAHSVHPSSTTGGE